MLLFTKNLVFSSYLDWLQIPEKKQKKFIFNITIFWLLLIIILIVDFNTINYDLEEGKEATHTIICPKNITFVDEKKTMELRKLAEQQVEPVIIHLENAETEMLSKLERFLEELSTLYNQAKSSPEAFQNINLSFQHQESLLSNEVFRDVFTLSPSEFEKVKKTSLHFLKNYTQQTITNTNIEIVKTRLAKEISTLPGSYKFKQVITELVKNSLTINAIEDEKKTREKRLQASKSVVPVVRNFIKGQKIIEKGVIVTADDIYVLKMISMQLQKNRLLILIGVVILSFVLISITLSYLRIAKPNILREDESCKLIGSLWLIALIFAKFVYTIKEIYDIQAIAYLLTPLPTIGILMHILLDINIALFNQINLGLLMLLISQANAKFAIISILGGIIGILGLSNSIKDTNIRSKIGWAGLKVGFVNSFTIFALSLFENQNFINLDIKELVVSSLCGFGNGVLTAISTNGALPYIESLFSLATSSRLLELADLSQPLLKKLAEEAPGTYQHSIIVANLAEAAATEIGADALLAKIGGYYHDIGKLKRPAYFIENQKGFNLHDNVTPYMSSLILVGHVRDGIELGKEYGLPQKVLDLIAQHHGTSLITYFYEQAKTSNTDGSMVQEERFRYPGPKPQTKEAAILMLADAVEAGSRTLTQYSASRIDSLVEKIIEYKFNDEHQLDESDLTLKDLEKIQQIFVKLLICMYHGRIDYPGKLSNQPKGGADGSINQQSAKDN